MHRLLPLGNGNIWLTLAHVHRQFVGRYRRHAGRTRIVLSGRQVRGDCRKERHESHLLLFSFMQSVYRQLGRFESQDVVESAR